ncbi:S66 peptidase family protein [Alkalicoccobacillus murimartini]|uniref:Muramoyltetrapeptide carboxypeptidase n=1 Tax=Alkalicoccobacillus murimartini TaxID=171685 RepID=A0ABT9YC12_9BACI|nr:LD-carboxypeptidase [Alkalicoccobacillus murimartini]MDQ0205352.1 muramoyltetrapeptide carboxypeptidase [Alkalicoccobacillus murimartini]
MANKPAALQQGDTIGIVTLGSPLDPAVINTRADYLRSLGFNVIFGENVYAQDGFLAGSAEDRAADLMRMFNDDSVKMILPSRGGVGVAGILPFLDFDVIKQNPKILTGYSDITVLQNVLYQYADLLSFQSLLLIDFRPTTPDYNFNQFYSAVSAPIPSKPLTNPPEDPLISLVPGNVTGELIGGNITSFVDTLGTDYEIDTSGKILVLEETHEPINTVYRYLSHLKEAGAFEQVAGIIMGECTNCEEAYGVSYDGLIESFIVPLGKPLITNLKTAHGFYKAAVPIGANVNLDANNSTITILEPTVS